MPGSLPSNNPPKSHRQGCRKIETAASATDCVQKTCPVSACALASAASSESLTVVLELYCSAAAMVKSKYVLYVENLSSATRSSDVKYAFPRHINYPVLVFCAVDGAVVRSLASRGVQGGSSPNSTRLPPLVGERDVYLRCCAGGSLSTRDLSTKWRGMHSEETRCLLEAHGGEAET